MSTTLHHKQTYRALAAKRRSSDDTLRWWQVLGAVTAALFVLCMGAAFSQPGPLFRTASQLNPVQVTQQAPASGAISPSLDCSTPPAAQPADPSTPSKAGSKGTVPGSLAPVAPSGSRGVQINHASPLRGITEREYYKDK